jgi:hypothetical protein
MEMLPCSIAIIPSFQGYTPGFLYSSNERKVSVELQLRNTAVNVKVGRLIINKLYNYMNDCEQYVGP